MEGGLKVGVISAGARGSYREEEIQKIRLKFKMPDVKTR